jgi:hypothetical protein
MMASTSAELHAFIVDVRAYHFMTGDLQDYVQEARYEDARHHLESCIYESDILFRLLLGYDEEDETETDEKYFHLYDTDAHRRLASIEDFKTLSAGMKDLDKAADCLYQMAWDMRQRAEGIFGTGGLEAKYMNSILANMSNYARTLRNVM